MVYNVVSAEAVINKVITTFGIKGGTWIPDAIEAIADGIGIMGCGTGYEKVTQEKEVTDYKTTLPCNIEVLRGVSFNGGRLRYGNGFSLVDGELDNLPLNADHYYTIKPGFIETSFKSGIIKIHFYRLQLDENGYPCVPDNTTVITALSWYALRTLLLQGKSHPVVDYQLADATWEKLYPRAQNDIMLANIDKASMLKDAIINLMPNISREEGFFQQR
jgi:hypothetical protein